jgi:hypothetical protein
MNTMEVTVPNAGAPDRSPDPEDGMTVARRRGIQEWLAWCGVAFVVLFFGGWGLVAGEVPPPVPSWTATQVAHFYSHNADLVRFGLLIGMGATMLGVPFSLVISLQMRRAEGSFPALAILQFASGVMTTVVLIIPMLLFLGAAYRPERTPELTQLVNDLSWTMIILPWPPLLGQMIPLAISTLMDRRRRPVFPRWSGYWNLWVAVTLLPVSLLEFWHFGPFSWDGLLGFWLGAATFGSWYPVMTFLTLRAIKAEAEEAQA